MRAAKPIVILLAGMLLLLPLLDCFSYVWVDGQSCDCCGSMGCTPGNPDQDCCRVAPTDTAVRLPGAMPVLRAPALVALGTVFIAQPAKPATPQMVGVAAPEAGPPQEFFLLHLALLI